MERSIYISINLCCEKQGRHSSEELYQSLLLNDMLCYDKSHAMINGRYGDSSVIDIFYERDKKMKREGLLKFIRKYYVSLQYGPNISNFAKFPG